MSPGTPPEDDPIEDDPVDEEDPIDAEVVEPIDVVDVYPSSIDGIMHSEEFVDTYITKVPHAWVGQKKMDAEGNEHVIKRSDKIIRNPAYPDVFMMNSRENAERFLKNGLVWNQDADQMVRFGIELKGPCADRHIVSNMVDQDERPLLSRLFHDPGSLLSKKRRKERKPSTNPTEIRRRQGLESARTAQAIVDGYPDALDRAKAIVDAIKNLPDEYKTRYGKNEPSPDIDGVMCSKNQAIIIEKKDKDAWSGGRTRNPAKFLRDNETNRARFIRNGYRMPAV